MFNAALIRDKTIVREKGDGPAGDVSAASGKVLLLSLSIIDVIEQQALDVTIWGSPDGVNWGEKPLLAFPQKFYRGQHPLLLDLSKRPDVKFVRAHWEVGRWGRGSETPMFEFHVSLREVPQEILAEAAGRVRTK